MSTLNCFLSIFLSVSFKTLKMRFKTFLSQEINKFSFFSDNFNSSTNSISFKFFKLLIAKNLKNMLGLEFEFRSFWISFITNLTIDPVILFEEQVSRHFAWLSSKANFITDFIDYWELSQFYSCFKNSSHTCEGS